MLSVLEYHIFHCIKKTKRFPHSYMYSICPEYSETLLILKYQPSKFSDRSKTSGKIDLFKF